MYDTVHFKLDASRIQHYDKDVIAQYLNSLEVGKKDNREHYYTGYLGTNFRTTVNDSGVKLRGSLCKYFKGYSLEPFSFFEVKQAIEKISDNLHLPFSNAFATRIDFGRCYFDLQSPVTEYLRLLDSFGHYQKHEKFDSVYFELKTNKRTLVFYDKIAEMKADAIAKNYIPEKYLHQNVLKYEIRFNREVGKQLKGKGQKVWVSDLVDEHFYNRLQNWYFESYERLKKQKILVPKW